MTLNANQIALPYNKGKPLSLQQITDFLSEGTKTTDEAKLILRALSVTQLRDD